MQTFKTPQPRVCLQVTIRGALTGKQELMLQGTPAEKLLDMLGTLLSGQQPVSVATGMPAPMHCRTHLHTLLRAGSR
jgi:hypothetical protein